MFLKTKQLREELEVDKVLLATIKDNKLEIDHSFDDKDFSLLQFAFLIFESSLPGNKDISELEEHPDQDVKLLAKLYKDTQEIYDETILKVRDLAIRDFTVVTTIYRPRPTEK